MSYFNPRSREGSDPDKSLRCFAQFNFNPRSREGSDRTGSCTGATERNFNPRSREGSDGYSDRSSVAKIISIRAPARGATTPAAFMIF